MKNRQKFKQEKEYPSKAKNKKSSTSFYRIKIKVRKRLVCDISVHYNYRKSFLLKALILKKLHQLK